jgi:hypothetical protein
MIDEVFRLVNFISDKDGRGYIAPAKFNLLAKTCQIEFISSRLGNIKQIMPNGVPPFGFKSTRRVDVDLRPFLYGPITISVDNQGNFTYPSGFMWPDSWQKNDFTPIREIQSDEYPAVKTSVIAPPTTDYPIVIFNNPSGFIDPYQIGSFKMSYVKYPPDPVWGYTVVSNEPVYNPASSTDFTLGNISLMDIAALILEKVGINLNSDQVAQYAQLKMNQGT